MAVPLPVGDHFSIRHHPLELESKLKPWMWNTQTCGSIFLIGSASPGSSWIFTVPLNPGGLLLPPPVAAAGLDAAKTRRARPVMKVRAPDALRTFASCVLRVDAPHAGPTAPHRTQGLLHRRAGA
jgi:hypothetical protein